MQLSLLGGSFQLVISKWLVNLVTSIYKPWKGHLEPGPLTRSFRISLRFTMLKNATTYVRPGGAWILHQVGGFSPTPKAPNRTPQTPPSSTLHLAMDSFGKVEEKGGRTSTFLLSAYLGARVSGRLERLLGVNGLGLGVKSSNLWNKKQHNAHHFEVE